MKKLHAGYFDSRFCFAMLLRSGSLILAVAIRKCWSCSSTTSCSH